MSEASSVTKPAISKPLGDQYGTLPEKLTFWARFATHSQMRDVLNMAAREIEKTGSTTNRKGK